MTGAQRIAWLVILPLAATAPAAPTATAPAPSVEMGPLITLPPNLVLRYGQLGWRFAGSLTFVLGIGTPQTVGQLSGRFRPVSVALEPGLVFDTHGARNLFFRWGLRRRWQVWPWVALGLGAGVTHEIVRHTGVFTAASPEAFMLVGHCCDNPGYFVIATRYELSFDRSEGSVQAGWQF